MESKLAQLYEELGEKIVSMIPCTRILFSGCYIWMNFLKKNRAEAMEVSIFEYNEELHLANLRREGYEEGIIHGKQQCILEFLEEMSPVSEEVCEIIEAQNDIEILSEWLKLSARVGSIDEFINMIKAKSDL